MNPLIIETITAVLAVIILAAIVYYNEDNRKTNKKIIKAINSIPIYRESVTRVASKNNHRIIGLNTSDGIDMKTTVEADTIEEAIDKWIEINALDKSKYNSEKRTFFGWPIAELEPQQEVEQPQQVKPNKEKTDVKNKVIKF